MTTELSNETLERLMIAIATMPRESVEWMQTQSPPWLTLGQGLQHLSQRRADMIIASPERFLRAVKPANVPASDGGGR